MKCPQSYHPSSFQLYYLAIVSIITVVHPSHAYVHHGKAHYCETQCSREAAGKHQFLQFKMKYKNAPVPSYYYIVNIVQGQEK